MIMPHITTPCDLRIGNSARRGAARATAEEIGRAILLARSGESFQLSATPVRVRPIAAALTLPGDTA